MTSKQLYLTNALKYIDIIGLVPYLHYISTIFLGFVRMLNPTQNKTTFDQHCRLLNELPVAILVLDNTGIIQFCNQTATELFAESLIGTKWLDLIKDQIKSVSHQGNYVVLKSNAELMVSTQSSEALKGQILLLTDISNINAESTINNKLSHLKSINQLSSGLAHQLKTPLATSLVYLSTIKSFPELDSKMKEPVSRSIEQLKIIENLIENELAIFKAQDIKVECIELNHTLTVLVKDFRELFKNLQFNLKFSSKDSTYIFAHKEALMSAISNIIDNAIEASAATGAIDITTLVQDSKVYLNIIDYGDGIKQSNLDKIEQLYFTTKNKGSGIGLPIAKSIIEAHQGTLTFSSNCDYTTFTICLPCKRDNNG